MKISLIIFAFAFLLCLKSVTYACSCVEPSPSVGEAYASADAVFIGTVEKAEESEQVQRGDPEFNVTVQIANVQIEKVFKGSKATEAVFRTEYSSCASGYEVGARLLFYAYYDKKNRMWETHACDRGGAIEKDTDLADDLMYLQALPASARRTRLSGVLEHFEDYPGKRFTHVGNIIGAKVKITGANKTYVVYTDKNGVYEIYDLPPGQYAVEPEIPVGLKISFPMYYGEVADAEKTRKVVLKAKSSGGVNFLLSSDTSVSGKVYGADGRALPKVCLRLVPKGMAVSELRGWQLDCTDEQGRYSFDEIAPGEYLIVANEGNKISSDEPFPTAYYPGVFDEKSATVLTITSGSKLEDYDIHIPSQEATKVIQGVLLFSDGRPLAGESVEFKAETEAEGYQGRAIAKTDAQGRFSLTVLQGMKGSLRGIMFAYQGKYINCPQFEKLVKAQGQVFAEIKTSPVKIDAATDIQDIKLVFPFPYCAKAKVD